MKKRRPPIETIQKATIIYPSGLFSLERDEIFPYERFAYNALYDGIYTLNQINLPDCLTLDFTYLSEEMMPWLINCSISSQYTSKGDPLSFKILVPELLPAIIYMFCNTVVSELFDDESYKKFKSNPRQVYNLIQHFADGCNASIRAYKEKGIGQAIRAGYEYFGLGFSNLYNIADEFDLLIKQIAYHEIAHAYICDLQKQSQTMGAKRLAFELVADLISTAWFFNKMIRLTPDTEEYRNFKGKDTYGETIFANSLMVIRSQQAILLLSSIAGAQSSGGNFSLSGSQTHPPGLQRHLLQESFLSMLIEIYFSNVLSEPQLEKLVDYYKEKMFILVNSGLIGKDDVKPILDPLECDTLEAAADLIEKYKIPELINNVDHLRSYRENLSEWLNKKT